GSVFEPLDCAPGCAGAVVCFVGFVFSSTEPVWRRLIITDKTIEVIIKITADQVVALVRTLAEERGPKAVCDPMPPKAAATSPLWPLCSRTTMTMKKQTTI